MVASELSGLRDSASLRIRLRCSLRDGIRSFRAQPTVRDLPELVKALADGKWGRTKVKSGAGKRHPGVIGEALSIHDCAPVAALVV
jgi:hypothetical protein